MRRSPVLLLAIAILPIAPCAAAVELRLGVPAGQGYPGTDYAGDAQFGSSVDIEFNDLVISAPNLQAADDVVGAIFLYHMEGGAAVFSRRLLAPGALFEAFGSSLSIRGGRLIATSTERIYIWETVETDQPPRILDLSSPGPRSLAQHQDKIVVGVPQEQAEQGSGNVYVYEQNEAGFWQVQTLPRGSPKAQSFGASLAVGTDWIAVGSPLDDGPNAPDDILDCGNVYIFRKLTGSWQRVQTLAGSSNDARMGAALATERQRLFVGIPNSNSRGAVSEYQIDGQMFQPRAVLIPEAWPVGGLFGQSIDIEGSVLAIGAPGSRTVHRYELSGDEWMGVQISAPAALPVSISGEDFGSRVSVSESAGLVVGTPAVDDPARPFTVGEGNAWLFSTDRIFRDAFE